MPRYCIAEGMNKNKNVLGVSKIAVASRNVTFEDLMKKSQNFNILTVGNLY
jgi:hypothetical protein